MLKKLLLLCMFVLFTCNISYAYQRDQIKIVGSSTALPFTSLISENFGKNTKFRTPIVESNGTGGGIHQFCQGVGLFHPDIAAASRRIKPSEIATCKQNFVNDIIEIEMGYDGVIIGQAKTAYPINLSLPQLRSALAQYLFASQKMTKNPYQEWQDISSAFPDENIRIFGPPPSSGTRETLEDRVLIDACDAPKDIKQDRTYVCRRIREDGQYVDSSTNENLIINKIIQSPNTVGIFGYSFYQENRDHVRAIQINGIKPTYENISHQKYPITRSIYLYIKAQHLDKIAGLSALTREILSEHTIGDEGYLIPKGFIARPLAQRNKMRKKIENDLVKN